MAENKHTIGDLYQMQSLPLSAKIRMTEYRIKQWVEEYGEDGVYVSFSGGKDSTVLLDIARRLFPNIKAAFVDTGLEYPEIRQFVKGFDNVDWIRPKLTFKQVIEKYGYPFISKEVSECVAGARKYLTSINAQKHALRERERYAYHIADLLGIDRRENKGNQDYQNLQMGIIPSDAEIKKPPVRYLSLQGKLIHKEKGVETDEYSQRYDKSRYKFFLDATFEISSTCCKVMKKSPMHDYAKRTGRKPMTAQMASESRLRTQQWLKNGCNGFHMKSPISNPMSFWTEQDVLLYIREQELPICSVYGEVVTDDEERGQLTLADVMDSELFEFGRPALHTTGCERTGCMFCGYGCHLEKQPNRFEKMKITHPKQYEYIMRGGHWRYRVFNFKGEEICLRHCSQEQIEKWVESNKENPRFKIEKGDFFLDGTGLGYREVIDWINENGNMNIKY